MAFERCYLCHGKAPAAIVIQKFEERECGHLYCLQCKITHDGDVDEISTETLTAADIQKIDNDDEYRKLFVETSNVRNEAGEDYGDYEWDDQKELRDGVSQHVIQSIHRHFSDNKPLRIIDIGCASGFTSVSFADAFPDSSIVSLDPSPQVKGVDGYRNQIRAVQSTLQGAEIEANSYDVAVIIGNMMLHDDPLDTLSLALDVLKPGGLLVFDFKNIKSSPRVIGIFLSRIGLAKFLPKSLFDRNFLNMRFGYHEKYVTDFLQTKQARFVNRRSKPPRLLEFGNKSAFSGGWKGLVWRILNKVDEFRGQQAWLQLEFVKESSI